MALYENSRYLNTTLYSRLNLGTNILGFRNRYVFNLDKCSSYEWCEGDTLDGVSFKQYGICALRWAILDANPKYRTEFDIENGDIIQIPDFEEVVRLVNVT